jgi:hypothetical protein
MFKVIRVPNPTKLRTWKEMTSKIPTVAVAQPGVAISENKRVEITIMIPSAVKSVEKKLKIISLTII